jgi:hypothetical protein
MLILELRPHGRSMLLLPRRQFRRPGAHLYSALPAVKAHVVAATVVVVHAAIINVMHDCDVHIVVRAVVVEMSAAPVAALVAETDIAKAVIDAAIVADVRAPVATVKAVAVIVVAPVAGGPESALVGSLDPPAGHPVVAALTPCPVAGRP